MQIEVVTLFPELFESPLSLGLLGRAIEEGRAQIGFVDPRGFATDRHRSVDDAPYGGGAGMVMKVDVLAPAIAAARARATDARVILLCPQGRPFDQKAARRLAGEPGLVLVCGRYEGFDERVRDLVDEEISLGDFVLTGGEYAALAVIDSVVRLLPGTLGNAESAASDSFEAGVLEHPHYTRPSEFMGHGVPAVLQSGDHQKIAEWRRREALRRTKERRPELLGELAPSTEDELTLAALPRRAEISMAASVHSAAEALALLELAEAYELSSVHFVITDPATRSAATDEIVRFGAGPSISSGRRPSNAEDKRRRTVLERRRARRSALAAGSSVVGTSSALHEVFSGAIWIGDFAAGGTPLGPAALRAELLAAPSGTRFLLSRDLDPPPPPARVLRGLLGRAGRLDSGNTGALGLAIWLDRLLGEA